MNNRAIMDRARNKKGQYMSDRRMGMGPDRNRFHMQRKPMDYNYNSSEYDSIYDYNMPPDYKGSNYSMGDQHYGQPYRSNEYQGYAQGTISYYPEYTMDYHMEDEQYKKELHHWIEKLKSKDTLRVHKEQVINQAKSMGVEFKKYNEDEFYAVYLMHVSDYPNMFPDYMSYIKMAKFWLDDDDVEYRGSEKICGYLTHIVLGE